MSDLFIYIIAATVVINAVINVVFILSLISQKKSGWLERYGRSKYEDFEHWK